MDGQNIFTTTVSCGLRVSSRMNFFFLAFQFSKSSFVYRRVSDNLNFYVDGKYILQVLKHPSDTVIGVAKLPHNSRYIWQEGSTRLAPFDKEVRTFNYSFILLFAIICTVIISVLHYFGSIRGWS